MVTKLSLEYFELLLRFRVGRAPPDAESVLLACSDEAGSSSAAATGVVTVTGVGSVGGVLGNTKMRSDDFLARACTDGTAMASPVVGVLGNTRMSSDDFLARGCVVGALPASVAGAAASVIGVLGSTNTNSDRLGGRCGAGERADLTAGSPLFGGSIRMTIFVDVGFFVDSLSVDEVECFRLAGNAIVGIPASETGGGVASTTAKADGGVSGSVRSGVTTVGSLSEGGGVITSDFRESDGVGSPTACFVSAK